MWIYALEHADGEDPSDTAIVISHPPDRRRATIAGLTVQYATVAIQGVQSFLLVPLYVAYIDARLYGAWLAAGSVLLWISLVDLCAGGIIQQRVGQAYGSGDERALGAVVGTGLFVNCVFAIGQ